jgi:hypothetical protein
VCLNINYNSVFRNGTASAPKSNKTSPVKEGAKQDNPFEEDEWDEESAGALTDSGEPGLPVRALYDYTGAESDELSFRQGDTHTHHTQHSTHTLHSHSLAALSLIHNPHFHNTH